MIKRFFLGFRKSKSYRHKPTIEGNRDIKLGYRPAVRRIVGDIVREKVVDGTNIVVVSRTRSTEALWSISEKRVLARGTSSISWVIMSPDTRT